MGNIAAPSIANIYLANLEQNILNIHGDDLLAYYRFIDEISIIVKKHLKIKFLKFDLLFCDLFYFTNYLIYIYFNFN